MINHDLIVNHAWQEINACWHFCHWWQESEQTRVTAMILLVAALLVLTLTITIALVRTVRRDGYGSRPPPRSHLDASASFYDLRIVP